MVRDRTIPAASTPRLVRAVPMSARDNSYADAPQRHGPYKDPAQAHRAVKTRQATIRGAITRRSNKAKAGENGAPGSASESSGGSWGDVAVVDRGWVVDHEAEAWLGMDD